MVIKFLKSTYSKFTTALRKARSLLSEKIHSLFRGKIDGDMLDQLEQLLYEADFGVKTAQELTQMVKEIHRVHPSYTTEEYIKALQKHLVEELLRYPSALKQISDEQSPMIILIVGVNGNGKTTSTAKLAHLFSQNGKKVLVAAADTFRAAAIDQLETWAARLQIDIVKGKPKTDPSAVAFDAIQAAKSRNCDVVLIDTAGRLHTKTHLMQELEKMKRTCQKASSQEGPHEVLLVLDATTGQNAIEQAKEFYKFTRPTGIILTKIDGTAKGGIVFSIQKELQLPVKFIGTGEQIDDLQPFNPEAFVSNLFE